MNILYSTLFILEDDQRRCLQRNVVFNMICAWKSESQIIIAEKALAENWRLLG